MVRAVSSGISARQFLAGFRIGNAHLDAGHGAPHGFAAQGKRIVHIRLRHDGGTFRQTVADGDVLHIHFFHHAAHERLGAGGTGHDAGAQTGDVEALEQLVFQFGKKHGGYAVQSRAAFAVHGGQYGKGIEFFDDDHAGSMIDAGHDAQHTAETVEQGHAEAEAILFGKAHVAPYPVAVEAHAHMGEHDALGKARRTRGVLHVDDVPGIKLGLPGAIVVIADHDGEHWFFVV